MKVLHYLDSMARGGTETQALDVCRNAARFGIELTLVAGGGGPLEADFRASGVEVIKLNRRLPVDIYLASQLRKIIREKKIELVRGFQAVEGLHLYLATRSLPLVKTALSYEGFICDRKNRVTTKFLASRVDSNIYVSDSLRDWLRDTDGLDVDTNAVVLLNGADPARLKGTGRSIKKELGISPDAPLFGMIANFYREPRKDHLTLAKALPAVLTEFPEAHCIFVGGVQDGAEHKLAECLDICLQAGLTDRVHFLGARNDVPDIYDELDIFVLSSLQEGLPVTISEAMLAGIPLIVSDIDPHLEATAGGKYASVFPTGDAAALADDLIDMLAHPEKRALQSKAAKAFAMQHLSIDAHLRELSAHYRKLIGE